jgi:hypothetical protein
MSGIPTAKPRTFPSDAHDVIVPVSEAIEEIRAGRMVILVDDEDRENEGDLCMAAERVTPEAINFMARYGRGLICLPLSERRLEQLHLHMMVPDHENALRRHHRNLGGGPSAHDSHCDRSRRAPRRPGPARPRLPAASA